jgi:hypothetical protein
LHSNACSMAAATIRMCRLFKQRSIISGTPHQESESGIGQDSRLKVWSKDNAFRASCSAPWPRPCRAGLFDRAIVGRNANQFKFRTLEQLEAALHNSQSSQIEKIGPRRLELLRQIVVGRELGHFYFPSSGYPDFHITARSARSRLLRTQASVGRFLTSLQTEKVSNDLVDLKIGEPEIGHFALSTEFSMWVG